jgi:hypothetical protein
MKTHCEEVIITTELRGDGQSDPYRRVVLVFSKDGTFIAENDPCLRDELRKLIPHLDSPMNKKLSDITNEMNWHQQ